MAQKSTVGTQLARSFPVDQRIDVDNPESLRYWSEQLCASAEELKRAIDQVGPEVRAVKKHLFGAFTDGGPSS